MLTTAAPAAFASSGKISGVGFAQAKMIGSFAIVRTISGVSVPGAETPIKIWNAVFEAGAEFGIKPIGLGARDTLRLEMGFCLYGNDLDDTTSPIEAGLGWITKFVEGKNFINRPMLEKQKTEGTVRKLVGFEMVDRGIPRHGYELQNPEGTPIGVVTSGTMSPTRKIGIGMGYVKPEYSKVGTEICIDMRGRKLKAVVVRPPFRGKV